MNKIDSEQIRKNLVEEYNENVSKINELDTKIRLLYVGSFEWKAFCVLGFFSILWFISIPLLPKIVNLGIIPLNLIQPLCVGIPTLIGITGEELFSRKNRLRERLRKFSISRTQEEKIEESTRYKIEQEKLRSANKVLKKIYDDLLADENLISSLSTRYNITVNDKDERTKKEINDSIKNINNILEQKQKEVDIITIKSVLKHQFWRYREKFNIFSTVLIFGMMGGFLSMAFCAFPIVYMNNLENIQLQTSYFGVFGPFSIGALAWGGYFLKRRINHTSVFKTINDELGDNALSEFCDYEEEKQLNRDLENAINNACAVRLKLESEKQQLNHVSEKIIELEVPSETLTAQIDYLKNEELLEDEVFSMEENIHGDSSKEQGPVLRKIINPQNNNN